MAFKFDRKLNDNIPKKNPTKITMKSEKSHLVCFGVLQWLLRASESRFERFISQRLGSRAALYYVNEKVGKIEVQCDPSFRESTTKTSLNFA